MSEWADHKFRSALLREAAAAIVAENDRVMWATKPGKHWAADLLNGMAATSDAVVEQGALPVPAGTELEAQSLPLRTVVELNDLRMRLAAVANPPREVFLALYDGAEPELFTTVEAARECCDDLAKTDAHDRYWDWTVNEYGVHVQFWTHPDDDRPLSETSGSVLPVVVQGDEPLSELEQLRARVVELEQANAGLDDLRVRALDKNDTLGERIAELETERRSTNEALDDAVKALRERDAQLAVADGRVPFEYVDAHNHRILLNNKTTDARDRSYIWFQAEDLAIGGAMVNVWLPVAKLEPLDAALAAGAGFEFTDHTGDAIAVAPAAEDWTVFTFTRCPDDEDDQEPTTVRVVVLTARVPQLRAALNLLRAETGGAR